MSERCTLINLRSPVVERTGSGRQEPVEPHCGQTSGHKSEALPGPSLCLSMALINHTVPPPAPPPPPHPPPPHPSSIHDNGTSRCRGDRPFISCLIKIKDKLSVPVSVQPGLCPGSGLRIRILHFTRHSRARSLSLVSLFVGLSVLF